MMLTWPSPAKLNLFLNVIGRRSDGYHNLQTLYQFLDYGDTLTYTLTIDGIITLLNPITGVAVDDNLIIRAARLLADTARAQHRLPNNAGVKISLNKKIPLGGGLGGGSSNAATTLLALNTLWKIGYSLDELAEMGLKLGMDVPLFVHGVAALAQGRGELLTPATPDEKWYLVAKPPLHIATSHIFNDPLLTYSAPIDLTAPLPLAQFSNDCEAVVRKRFSEVDELIRTLLDYAPTRLTGTGACAFAEFASEHAANRVRQSLPAYDAFVAKGANVSPLHRFMKKMCHPC